MTRRPLSRLAWRVALALCTLHGVAHAEGTPAAPTQPGGLALEVGTGHADAVRAEIERELALLRPQPRGRLLVREEHAEGHTLVVVTFEAEDGRRLERTLEVQGDPEARAEEIALLAANVVRDDAAGLEAAPRAREPVRPAPPAPPPAGVCAPASLARRTVGADVVPYLGTSSAASGRKGVRRLSLNALGGLSAGFEGVEIGGLVNVDTHSSCGVQVAGLANVVTGDVRGLQLAAVVNRAERVHGVQLGLVNVATRSDLSLGLVNVNTSGRTHLDAWVAPESGILAAALKHGGAHWHSIYGAGGKLSLGTDAGVDFVAVLGLGAHVPLPPERLFLDVDVLYQFVHRFDDDDRMAHHPQARAVLGVRLLDALALFAGPTFNVLVQEEDDGLRRAPPFAANVGNLDTRVELWPGLAVGVTAFTDKLAGPLGRRPPR